MRKLAFGLLASLFFAPITSAAPYQPPPGFTRLPETFNGDAFAVAPDGKVAVAQTFPNVEVDVYANAAAAQAATSPIRTFTPAGAQFWGDLTFTDNDTLLITENSGINTVLSGTVSTGALAPLAPNGSVPNAAGVVKHNGDVYAVAVQGSGGQNDVYKITAGIATKILSNIGVGFLGGIAFDTSGNMLLTDTNDSGFLDNPGKLLRFDPALIPLPTIDLASGNGLDAYDVAVDSEGDIFVSTYSTLTMIKNGSTIAQQFGSKFGDGMFGFPGTSNLDFVGSPFERDTGGGVLWINAGLAEDASIFGISSAPEPAAGALLLIAGGAITLRRRRFAATAALSLVGFAFVAFAKPQAACADQFFATQVVNTVVGTQQQAPQFANPAKALGAPRGGGTSQNGLDVYNLGNGGSITLGFDDTSPTSHRYIVDGPGPDFIVSENPFYADGEPHNSFAELMFVEVSSDGTNFQRFLNYSTTPDRVGATGTLDPDNLAGFAGVMPVLANADNNTINPFEVGAAGGDVFDLSALKLTPLVQSGAVDLQHIRYLRLVDVIGDGSAGDSFGRPIYDPTGFGIGGADVDAVAVINGAHAPEPAALAVLMTAAVSMIRMR